MPLTPHGSPHLPGAGMSARAALLLGAITVIGGILVTLLAHKPLDGLMFAGFGAAMLAWGGLLAGRGHPRLLLLLGALGVVVAFVAAFILAFG